MRKRLAVLCVLGLAISAQAQVVDMTLDGQPQVPSFVDAGGGTGVSAPQKVSMFASINATSGLDYTAALLDRAGAVTGGLFIKVQNQAGTAVGYNTCGFYQGINGGGWTGMTGGAAFFVLPVQFTDEVITVEHDGAGNVTLTCTGGPFTRGGWVPLGGSNAGIGFFSNLHRIDDFVSGGCSDNFNRADGPIGANWSIISGALNVSGNRASGGAGNGVMTTCGPACTGAEAIKKAKCKKGKLKVVTVGGNPGETVTVEAAGKSGSATVDAKGKATVKIPGIEVTGEVEVKVSWSCLAVIILIVLCG